MKKALMMFMVAFAASCNAKAAEEIKLPVPDTKGGIPLMEAIARRQSTREFSAKAIDDQTLSDVLFAAWGVSHDGKRTIPTAMNKQNLRVFAARKDGVWEYDGSNNSLKKVSDTDLTPALAEQDYVQDAPLTLIFTGTDKQSSPMNAAAAYQNVGLYCASRGMHNVVRGYINRAEIAKTLGLGEAEIIVSQTIGWPYM